MAANEVNAQHANITGSIKYVAEYKSVCSRSLVLLNNTVGSVLWAGKMRAGCLALLW